MENKLDLPLCILYRSFIADLAERNYKEGASFEEISKQALASNDVLKYLFDNEVVSYKETGKEFLADNKGQKLHDTFDTTKHTSKDWIRITTGLLQIHDYLERLSHLPNTI